AFAAVRPALADRGAVYVRFGVADKTGRVVARVGGKERYTAKGGQVFDEKGRTVIKFGPYWAWDAGKSALDATIKPGVTAELLVFTSPAEALPKDLPSYEVEQIECRDKVWSTRLAAGSSFAIPEPVVQNAWRAHVLGNFLIAVGDRMHYSAG